MHDGRKTLTRYTIEQEHRHPHATGKFSGLLNAIATAVKVIANQVNKGALVGSLDQGEGENIHSEVQKKLDVLSNETMLRECEWGGHLAAMASEEMESFYPVPERLSRGKYLLLFDPLDGSSNIELNLAVGSIFSILRSPSPGAEPQLEDFLQPGTEQVCAGFALYGPSTMLVLTTGHGVDGFTLDRDIGAFILTHAQLRVPEETQEFAINSSNERFWEAPVKRYVTECLEGKAGPRGKDFNTRWIASLVAETFRILTRGGVFLYPKDTRDATQQGRLRLMYEANPIAFIIEQAGGGASTGRERVMDVRPESLHQRVPLIFGSKDEVERVASYHVEYAQGKDLELSQPLFKPRSLFRTQ